MLPLGEFLDSLLTSPYLALNTTWVPIQLQFSCLLTPLMPREWAGEHSLVEETAQLAVLW